MLGFLFQGNALVALLAAIIWGGGDFSGGVAVKQAGGNMRSAFRVILLSHTVSVSLLLLLALRWGGVLPSYTSVAWGILAGLLAALSLAAFYVSLSAGAMGAAAAVSGLLAAAIPALVSFVIEGLPGSLHLLGFALAGIAIWRIAASPADPGSSTSQSSRTMTLAIIAGVGFGLYFVAMKMAGRGGLLWPMTVVRVSSSTTCALLVLATLRPQSAAHEKTHFLPRSALPWALGCAFLDTGGNLLFLAATRLGRLDVASVLASLYPASTILLAAWIFHERPSRRQAIGMLLAVVAVVLIAL